ncbi:hypothetical protein PCCS19_36230 [Paenibacillus sp. CCS19]|nr:hypothetical protein PCCS19_36230 [Paenibacillus cellulosilyticus]
MNLVYLVSTHWTLCYRSYIKKEKTLISQGFYSYAEDGGRTRTVVTHRRILSPEVAY